MDKEYLVFDTSRDSEIENTLNSWAEQGYEFCGIVNNPNIAGGKIGTSVIMRKIHERNVYAQPQETPEQRKSRIMGELNLRG